MMTGIGIVKSSDGQKNWETKERVKNERMVTSKQNIKFCKN